MLRLHSMLLALLFACRCNPVDPPQDVTFEAHNVQQVGGRFRGEPEGPLDPQVAFAAQGRCPELTRAHLRQANDQIREVTVYGTRLDEVRRVAAVLPDGTLASAQFRLEDGGLVFPIACTWCELYLGIQAGDRTAACFGPGYSLRLEDGQIAR